MATLYINEYQTTAAISGLSIMVVSGEALARQNVEITGSSEQSGAFNAGTHMIMVSTDSACSITIGNNPTADPSFERLAANETRFYQVNPNQKIAVISNS